MTGTSRQVTGTRPTVEVVQGTSWMDPAVDVNLVQISSRWIGGGETMQLCIIVEVLCENYEDDLDGSVGSVGGL